MFCRTRSAERQILSLYADELNCFRYQHDPKHVKKKNIYIYIVKKQWS